MRQVVLDTETTGLEANAGHRIIEIGCVELENRRATGRTFHRYVNPERPVDPGALEVHGIDNDFLEVQPRFDEIAEDFVAFLEGAELVIHNADFDVTFINHEFGRIEGLPADIRDRCKVLDTLVLARRMHPGQRNNLDALAKRYGVDNSKRELHGALLDAQILAEVYLAMSGGQVSLALDAQMTDDGAQAAAPLVIERRGRALTVIRASHQEMAAHMAFLEKLKRETGRPTLWERQDARESGGQAAPADVPDDDSGLDDLLPLPA